MGYTRMMKKLTAAIATVSTLGFANMAHAETFDTFIGEIDASMTATVATDYIWRGQSQTDGKGAFQASLDFAHESGRNKRGREGEKKKRRKIEIAGKKR